jgi:hypothetical protein
VKKVVYLVLLLAALLSIPLTACGKTATVSVTSAIPTSTAISDVDYSKPEHWLNLPSSPDKAVDVFYLYPTIFEPVGNIYAPYYRQVDSTYLSSLPLPEQEKIVGGIPAGDATAAFDYYIKHYNNGRPFILAGHSQGSNVLLYLLSEYMKEHPEVYKRMVAAYVVGYSVTSEYLADNPHLKFAEGPDDTGVIISYNTEAPVREGNNPVLLPGAQVINPITWTRDETLATADQNLGSMLVDANYNLVPAGKYADARVDKARGVLICSTADVEKLAPGKGIFGKGVYHNFDYLFYYYNIRANAAKRAEHFLQQNRSTP